MDTFILYHGDRGMGSIYFFDTFLKKRDVGWLGKCRYPVLYLSCLAIAYIGGNFFPMWLKVLAVVLIYITFSTVFYEAGWKQRIFFSVLGYSLLFLTDLFTLQMEKMFVSQSEVRTFLFLPSKMAWLCLVFIVRKIWKGRNNYGELSHNEYSNASEPPFYRLRATSDFNTLEPPQTQDIVMEP